MPFTSSFRHDPPARRDAEGREYLFGWRYYYGYPHFPMSALWFAPFIGITGTYNDIRIGNLVYLILNLLADLSYAIIDPRIRLD